MSCCCCFVLTFLCFSSSYDFIVSRTVLAKVYANDKCARRLYSHSPVLPDKPLGPSKESIWRRSSRPTIPEYVQGLVHYELAVEGDVPNVIKFWETKIGEQSPLLNSIGKCL